MFIRVKNTPNSPKRFVQIVKNIREGDKVKQKIVRHLGYASNEKALEDLKQLGYVIMEEIKQKVQRSLYSPEQLAAMVISAKQKNEDKKPLSVDLRNLRETDRVITGIHEVYGSLYDMLGFDKVIDKKTKKTSNSILKDIVMARIANPKSKRGNIIDLSRDFGISINLSSVYRMMDYIDEKRIKALQEHSFQQAQMLYPEKINVLFYDCTTLYFETVNEDELRAKGYSKDMKFNQSQVLLALLVTTSGLPVGYKLYKGNTFEGNTLVDALSHIKTQHNVEQSIFVADSALLSQKNIDLLEEKQQSYIVAARLKSFSEDLSREITTLEEYQTMQVNQEIKVREWLLEENKRLIVTYSPSRAKKDAYDRDKALKQLENKLKRSKNPMSLVNNYGYKKFVKNVNEGKVILDEKKIQEAKKWDGLHGVVTNLTQEAPEVILTHYRGLWEVEETFRISKHDMKVRPIYHWTPKRIAAHIAICYMALCCIRHLTYRIALQYRRVSAEEIRNELAHKQVSILTDIVTNKKYGVPSQTTSLTKKIYQILDKKNTDIPFLIK